MFPVIVKIFGFFFNRLPQKGKTGKNLNTVSLYSGSGGGGDMPSYFTNSEDQCYQRVVDYDTPFSGNYSLIIIDLYSFQPSFVQQGGYGYILAICKTLHYHCKFLPCCKEAINVLTWCFRNQKC